MGAENPNTPNISSVDITGESGNLLTLDVDGNGEANALTDGLLVVRYLFGFTGESLTRNAVGAGAARNSSDVITNYLSEARLTMLDVDGNGEACACTDGILVVRFLFGLTGEPLISGAVAGNAERTTSTAIEAHLQSFELGASNWQVWPQSDDLFASNTLFDTDTTAIL